MKISKLLSKKILVFFLFFIFFSYSFANEPADIWNIDKTKIETENDVKNETSSSSEISEENISVYDLNNQNNQNNKSQILQENKLENDISLY